MIRTDIDTQLHTYTGLGLIGDKTKFLEFILSKSIYILVWCTLWAFTAVYMFYLSNLYLAIVDE